MDLKALFERQIAADKRRGFEVDFQSDSQRHDQITKDLIGLLGEIGEFANLIKKVGLTITHPNYVGPSLNDASQELREELADAIIYIFRLSAQLGGDIEIDLMEKMNLNDSRYNYLER